MRWRQADSWTWLYEAAGIKGLVPVPWPEEQQPPTDQPPSHPATSHPATQPPSHSTENASSSPPYHARSYLLLLLNHPQQRHE
jgi:hypothetical protein